MRGTVLLAVASVLLTGCDRVGEFEAFTFCAEKLEELFPETKNMSGDEIGEGLEDLWNTDAAGNFDFIIPATDGSTLWSCSGNWRARRIDQVSYKTTVKEPPNSEVWSY